MDVEEEWEHDFTEQVSCQMAASLRNSLSSFSQAARFPAPSFEDVQMQMPNMRLSAAVLLASVAAKPEVFCAIAAYTSLGQIWASGMGQQVWS